MILGRWVTCFRPLAMLAVCLGLAGCDTGIPGDPNPDYPGVISSGDAWLPAPGYEWVDADAGADLRVRWSPGKAYFYLHEAKWPHVRAGDSEGSWYPDPGYTWSHRDAAGKVPPGDFTVAWKAGLGYWQNGRVAKPHLMSGKEEGVWYPAPGYVWAQLDSNGRGVFDAGVIWQPGAGYAVFQEVAWPNIHASDQEGSWTPDNGYAWAHPSNDGSVSDFAVYSLREVEEYRARERALDERWAAYLKEIQTQGDYPNWPSPPYDLYQQMHR